MCEKSVDNHTVCGIIKIVKEQNKEANKMLKKKEVYELLNKKAMSTGAAGTETVTVVIPEQDFNKDLHYRKTLYWEVEEGNVIVTDEAH